MYVERTFKSLKDMKDKTRNRLITDSLEALLLAKVNFKKEKIEEVSSLDDIVEISVTRRIPAKASSLSLFRSSSWLSSSSSGSSSKSDDGSETIYNKSNTGQIEQDFSSKTQNKQKEEQVNSIKKIIKINRREQEMVIEKCLKRKELNPRIINASLKTTKLNDDKLRNREQVTGDCIF